jgi:hypothetical protein
MKQWSTEISAHDPATGVLKVWCGPHVPGITLEDAQQYCTDHGMGYCKVCGLLISETPEKGTTDWQNETDYENISNN